MDNCELRYFPPPPTPPQTQSDYYVCVCVQADRLKEKYESEMFELRRDYEERLDTLTSRLEKTEVTCPCVVCLYVSVCMCMSVCVCMRVCVYLCGMQRWCGDVYLVLYQCWGMR